MTDEWGIQHEWTDASGDPRQLAPETVATLREVLGEPGSADLGPLFARRGEPVPEGVVQCEDGSELPVSDRLPESTPFGYHRLQAADGATRELIVSPGRCRLPEERAWGWAAQLYAARSRRSWGMGDFADLRELAGRAAAQGAGFVLINPVGAAAPGAGQQPSPYYPASRRFLSPLYLPVADLPDARRAGVDLSAAAAAGQELNRAARIDRDEIWRIKRAALQQIWQAGAGERYLAAWSAAAPALRTFATWAALCDVHGPDWTAWPVQFRRPERPEVAQFAAAHPDQVAFHGWLQEQCREQLQSAAGGTMLIQDLPIGFDPAGLDAWEWQDLLAPGVSVGAPPDEFNTSGQDWGLPPFVPARLAEAGYRPFRETVRACTAAHGGLRIDHVMGLFRLWWIPSGARPQQGGYVHGTARALLDILALESHRSQAVVIGEDLGTVEEPVRAELAARQVLSYRLLWFETAPPEQWPRRAMAAVTTHDLPTVAGLWTGSDLQEQRDLGTSPNEASTQEIRRRLAAGAGLDPDAPVDDAITGAHGLLGRAPCLLLAATLDDAAAEAARPNIPGVDKDRPNWCLPLPVPLEDLLEAPRTTALCSALTAAAAHT